MFNLTNIQSPITLVYSLIKFYSHFPLLANPPSAWGRFCLMYTFSSPPPPPLSLSRSVRVVLWTRTPSSRYTPSSSHMEVQWESVHLICVSTCFSLCGFKLCLVLLQTPAPTHITCSTRLTQQVAAPSSSRFVSFIHLHRPPVWKTSHSSHTLASPFSCCPSVSLCVSIRTLSQLCPSCWGALSQRSCSGRLTSTTSTEMDTSTKRCVVVCLCSYTHSVWVCIGKVSSCVCLFASHRRWQTSSEQYMTWWGSTLTPPWSTMHPNSTWRPSFR